MRRTDFGLLSLLAVVFSLVVASCSEPEPVCPELILSSDIISVDPDGGVIELPYEIKGFNESPEVRAVCDADWVGNFDYSIDGTLKFEVDATDIREARSAEVRVLVPGFGLSSSFTISQHEGDIPDFAITTYGLVENRVYYNVTPFDKDMTYIVLGCEKSRVAEFTTDEQWYEADMEYLQMLADMNRMSLEEVLDLLVRSGNTRDEVFYDLKPNTEYCIYAYGMTKDGKPTSSVIKEFYKTKELVMIDPGFNVDIEIDQYKVNCTFSTDIPDTYYLIGIVPPDEIEDEEAMKQQLQNYLDMMIQRWEANTNVTTEEAVAKLTVKGEYVYSDKFKPETDYVAYAISVSNTGLINSAFYKWPFKTGEILPSNNTFKVEIVDIRSNMAIADISPSNEDPCVYLVCPEEQFEGMSDEEIISVLSSDEYSRQLRAVKYGSTRYNIFNLTPQTDYVLYVFGYDHNVVTTGLSKTFFKTLAE